jgi:hypothetical protein
MRLNITKYTPQSDYNPFSPRLDRPAFTSGLDPATLVITDQASIAIRAGILLKPGTSSYHTNAYSIGSQAYHTIPHSFSNRNLSKLVLMRHYLFSTT